MTSGPRDTMTPSNTNPRGWVFGASMLLIIFASLAWTTLEGRRSSAQEEQTRARLDEMQGRIENVSRQIDELAANPDRHLISRLPEHPRPAPIVADELGSKTSSLEMASHLVQLATVQSNTLALLNRLISQGPAQPQPVSPELIQVLETKTAEHQQRVDQIQDQLATFLVNLQIPPEVAALGTGEALSDIRLQSYWPYFKLKHDLEGEQFMLDRLRVRTLQADLDLATQNASGKP